MSLAVVGGAVSIGGALGMFGDKGGGSVTVNNQTAPMSPEEAHLLDLQTQLSQAQLDNVNALKPYQTELINQSISNLQSQGKYQAALDAAITPEQQAQAAADQFKQAQAMAPMQQQLLQMQLDDLKRGGAATDAQKKLIGDAADSAIAAGTGDINTQTQRGIGMIADELANSRGMRLSDSPITGEAALLTRAGNDQVASLTKNLRAAQAQGVLNYPLAAQSLQSGINMNQQQLFQSAQNFQDQLRQQAYQNRLALTGPTTTTGLGLSSVGSPASSIYALNSTRGGTQTTNKGLGIGDWLSAGSKVMGMFS